MANTIVARATYKFEATQAGDLTFEAGDIITVINRSDTGWWTGRTADGRTGIFPYNRVKVLPQGQPQQMQQAPLPTPTSPTAAIPNPNANGSGGLGLNNMRSPKANMPTPMAPSNMSGSTAPFIVDRVNRVLVMVNESVAPTQALSFNVEISVSNASKVTGAKTMQDFRILNYGLNLLGTTTNNPVNGQFYKRATNETEHFEISPPEWADMLPLERGQIQQRAEQLQQYLGEAIGESAMDYLMVYWLNPNAQFSLSDGQKRHVGEVYRQSLQHIKEKYGSSRPVPQLARVAYNWTQRDDQEINLLKNEVIAVLDQNTMYPGWWLGQKPNGKQGVFPYNYVQLLPPDVAEKLVNPPRGAGQPTVEIIKQDKSSPGPIYDQSVGGFHPGDNNSKGRNRKRITKYSLCCTEAFDELLQSGVTIEENGRLAKFAGRNNTPKRGDLVTLYYSAYIWEPQKQELLEFASSDKLLSGGKSEGIASGPLEFTMGKEEAIEGVEEAVARMELNQSVRVTLTPDKGYGDVGYPPDIPGNAYLVYDLTLKDVKKNTQSVNKQVVGVVKSTVANRKPSGSYMDFKGLKSIQDIRATSQKEVMKQSQRRMKDLGAAQVGVGVDAEAFKKKLTIKQLQEIVKKRQFEEYGIVPGIMEEYLTDEEFANAFNVDHFTWLLMPAFKRKQLKQQQGLF